VEIISYSQKRVDESAPWTEFPEDDTKSPFYLHPYLANKSFVYLI